MKIGPIGFLFHGDNNNGLRHSTARGSIRLRLLGGKMVTLAKREQYP